MYRDGNGIFSVDVWKDAIAIADSVATGEIVHQTQVEQVIRMQLSANEDNEKDEFDKKFKLN